MKTVKLMNATDEQLIQFATQSLGLEINKKKDKRAVILSKIKAAYSSDAFELPDETPAKPAKAKDIEVASVASDQDLRDQQFVTVMIPETEKPGGTEPVKLSVNGRALYAPRGEPIDLRYPYFVALQNAKIDLHDDEGKKIRTVQAYNFSIIEGPHFKRDQTSNHEGAAA
jgi:hypothetical protein